MASASLLPSLAWELEVTGESLTDTIVRLIGKHCGPQLPCPQAAGILAGFGARFTPDEAAAIVRQAFDVHQGTWRGAPVTVLRFQAHMDGFFARPLLAEALGGGS